MTRSESKKLTIIPTVLIPGAYFMYEINLIEETFNPVKCVGMAETFRYHSNDLSSETKYAIILFKCKFDIHWQYINNKSI